MISSRSPNRRDWKLPPCRSYLYVSGTRPELFAKALASEADSVILDLEDGVAANRKQQARENVVELLEQRAAKPVFVRTNQLDSAFSVEDLTAVARLPIAGVRVPMVHRAEGLVEACRYLASQGFAGGVQAQLESAEGLTNLRRIARADPFVEMLSLGEGDLCAELGCDREFLGPARLELVVVSRAYGLQRPIQEGYPDLSGAEPPEWTSRAGRRAGFFGRIALHPAQVPAINSAYTPCIHEVEYARDAMARIAAAIDDGQTTTRDMHGNYLSVWYQEQGGRILREAELFGALDACPACSPTELRSAGGPRASRHA